MSTTSDSKLKSSENVFQKARRGRPKLLTGIQAEVAAAVAPNVTTERGRQNALYGIMAMQALGDDPRFAWLHDRERRFARLTILSELGRVRNPQTLLALALGICERKPRTRAAIGLIRAARGVKRQTEQERRKALWRAGQQLRARRREVKP